MTNQFRVTDALIRKQRHRGLGYSPQIRSALHLLAKKIFFPRLFFCQTVNHTRRPGPISTQTNIHEVSNNDSPNLKKYAFIIVPTFISFCIGFTTFITRFFRQFLVFTRFTQLYMSSFQHDFQFRKQLRKHLVRNEI